MNLSRQIKTTKKEALKFIDYMEINGYTAHFGFREGITDVHFTKDGKITADYGVIIIKGAGSWITVRVD